MLFTVYFDPVTLKANKEYFFAWNPDFTEGNYSLTGRKKELFPAILNDGVSLKTEYLVRYLNINKTKPEQPTWVFGSGGVVLYPCWVVNVVE